jgi:competence protein CoiA
MGDLAVLVRTAPVDCWSCGAETTIISSIELSRGEDSAECSVSDFTDYPQLIDPIQKSLPGEIDMGPLKLRHSKTLARSYMSNGCAHCDALFGQHFEIHTRYDETQASKFVAQGSEGWDAMLDDLLTSEDGHLFHF